MAQRDHHEHGTLSWTDLATPDADAARDFYGGLFGWDFEDNEIPGGGVYRMAMLGGRSAAAMFSEQDRHPGWTSYVTVEDVDAVTPQATELGAHVLAEPFDVMDAGRMAMLQDPTGAVFAVWQPLGSIGAEVVNGPGALTLNQLNTTDPEAARSFYSELFGWRIDAVPDAQTPYWGIYRGERMNAGMMQMPDEANAPSHWLVYFGTDDIDAAADRIGSSGGQLIVPRTEVPGGQIVVAQDGQGAIFGLFAGHFDD